ncbi:MAG: tyrosine-type recombinase/integrase [Spirochaetales bacterium]
MNSESQRKKNNIQSFNELIEEFLSYQDGVRNISPHSITAYRSDLLKATAFLQSKNPGCYITTVTLRDLRSYVGHLSYEKKSAASINRSIAALRSFFAYCERLEYIQYNVAAELKTAKQPIRVPKFMTHAEARKICDMPEKIDILWEVRDKALFEMMYSSGCRVSEIAGIRIEDISSSLDSALVTGKGKKDRRVFFSPSAKEALENYLRQRNIKLLKLHKEIQSKSLNLFINQKGQNLTDRGIRFIINRYSSVEGTNRHVSPHTFRHSFATTMLESGANIRNVQEMLGHSGISTTQRYTHVTSESVRAVYKQAHPHGGLRDSTD